LTAASYPSSRWVVRASSSRAMHLFVWAITPLTVWYLEGAIYRVTGGLLSNLGGVVIRIRIPCVMHVSCMYRERILMCPVHIQIHQDTTRYICRYVPLWIQLRYMYLIMYLSCISHVSSMYPRTSADTCISYVSRMYPACIPRARYIYPDVSDMYPQMYLGTWARLGYV
jgi:hypothetical protein